MVRIATAQCRDYAPSGNGLTQGKFGRTPQVVPATNRASLCQTPCQVMPNGPRGNQWVGGHPVPPYAKLDSLCRIWHKLALQRTNDFMLVRRSDRFCRLGPMCSGPTTNKTDEWRMFSGNTKQISNGITLNSLSHCYIYWPFYSCRGRNIFLEFGCPAAFATGLSSRV